MDLARWAQQAAADEFWLLTGILAVAAAAALVRGFMFLLKKRMIEDIPTSKVRSAAQGYVELEGRCALIDGPPIVSPLTGSHCVWYRYVVQERRGSGRNSRWTTLESGTSPDLFWLEDDTGQCVIDPEGARVTASVDLSWYGPNRDSRPRTTGRRWLSLGGRFRFRESRLHPGDPLYAIGLFKTVGAPGSGSDKQAMLKSLLREWKTDTDKLLERFDRNGDGEICLEEWQAVREAAWQEVVEQHAELARAEPAHTLSQTRDRRRPFLLSAVPQFDLVRRFQRYTIALLAFALAGGSLAGWLISMRLIG